MLSHLNLFLLALLSAASAHAQTQFDVVSIKPALPGARNSGYRRSPGGVLNATNVTVKMLITYAYDVKDYQVSGGPGWLDTIRYEVLAKSGTATTEPASAAERMTLMRAKVQALLADRFQLALHRTTKELPIFVLTVGKNGPKGLREPAPGEPDLVDNGHHFACHKTTLDSFAKIFLQGELGRPVINRTGLGGEYDFTMDWVPDEGQRRLAVEESAPNPPATADGPSFFTALQEQLGLRLEPSKGPVDILVIDHAERASEN
jgi:uncharacterized protein (TIGR03435 family)